MSHGQFAADELVPESLPPAAPEQPSRPGRLHWLLAFPATVPAMIVPRRFGPTATEASWACAYLVHILSGAVAFGGAYAHFQVSDGQEPQGLWSDVSIWNELRRPFAGLTTFLFTEVTGWDEWVALWAGVLLLHAGFWAAAVLMLPFVAAGEPRGRAYLRAVKVMLWSSMCAWPMGWILPYLVAFLEHRTTEIVPVALFLVWLTWLGSVALRLGGCYGGPAIGPRWQPRTLRCERCGYQLSNLPVVGRCPECGKPIAESLPVHRRRPSLATSRGLARIVAFLSTLARSLIGTGFFRSLAVWSGARESRQFAAGVAVCAGVLAVAVVAPLYANTAWRIREAGGPFVWIELASLMLAFGCGGACAVAFWLLAAGLAASGAGFLQAAPRAVVVCYSSGFVLIPLVLLAGAMWPAVYVDRWFQPVPVLIRTPFGEIDKRVAMMLLLFAPGAVTGLLSLVRVRHALRAARFANA